MDTSNLSSAKVARRDMGKHLFIWSLLAFTLFPFYMMMQISVKTNGEFNASPWAPTSPLHWHWSNYWYGCALILPSVANTVFVAVTTSFAGLFLALMAAYFFARYRMPGGGVLWGALMLLMLMPGVANIVPLFNLLKSGHLLNTLWALIIVGVAGAQVVNVYILRNFIEDLPRDLFEAAEMDGATHFQQLLNVVIPMSGPILGTLFILLFLGTWNDFLLPLITLRDPKLYTLGVRLIYLDGEYVKDWGKIMAAYFVASLPLIVIFLFMMKLFVRGLASGAVKG